MEKLLSLQPHKRNCLHFTVLNTHTYTNIEKKNKYEEKNNREKKNTNSKSE